jgi:hypothetical protein
MSVRVRPSTIALLPVLLLLLHGCQTVGNWVAGHVSPMDWKGQTRVELPLTSAQDGRPPW